MRYPGGQRRGRSVDPFLGLGRLPLSRNGCPLPPSRALPGAQVIMDSAFHELLTLAEHQEHELRAARERMDAVLQNRNDTIRQLRGAGASYGTIAKALGLTRAGVVGICRKLERQNRPEL